MRAALFTTLALVLAAGSARAQDAGTAALPSGHPPVGAAAADAHAHDATGGMAGLPNFRQMELPEQGAMEAPDLPRGVVLVRVVDARGEPLPDVTVRLGAMAAGERQAPRELRTRFDGVAQFEGLPTGVDVAYRASVEHEGARFSAPPFQLPSNAGYRVQLVRYDVEHEPRAVLISDARVEIGFQDDRVVVVQRASFVNFSSMSLDGQPPRPVAYVPREGLRFRLPAGFSAFRADEEIMGDQRITEENGYAVLRGSIPPTGPTGRIDVAFQYRIKLQGADLAFDVTLPSLPVLRATVVSQAPAGMQLDVQGMEPAEERVHNGQRILITGRQRERREDAPISTLRIRLSGLPSSTGPERQVATVLALLIVLGSLYLGVQNARGARTPRRDPEALRAERRRLMDEAAALEQARAAGDVGPQTYARRKREIVLALARVLRDLAEAKAPAGAAT
jgi:hypothetical protein